MVRHHNIDPCGLILVTGSETGRIGGNGQKGTLKIILKEGIDLKAADVNGKSDPYVIVKCGGQEIKSSVVQRSSGDSGERHNKNGIVVRRAAVVLSSCLWRRDPAA